MAEPQQEGRRERGVLDASPRRWAGAVVNEKLKPGRVGEAEGARDKEGVAL